MDLTHTLAALLFKAALDRDLIQFADVRARLGRGTLDHSDSASLSHQINISLQRISRFCKKKGWPPLTALYVKQPHFTASVGFYKSMQFEDKNLDARLAYWHSCVDAVYSYFQVGEENDQPT